MNDVIDDVDNDYIIKRKNRVHSKASNTNVIDDIDRRRRELLAYTNTNTNNNCHHHHHHELIEVLSSLVALLTNSDSKSITINDCSYVSSLISVLVTSLNNDITTINTNNSINSNSNIDHYKRIYGTYRNTYKCHSLFKTLHKYMISINTNTIGLHQIVSYLLYHILEGIPSLMKRALKHQHLLVRVNCYSIFDTYVNANTFITNANNDQKLIILMKKKGYQDDSISSSSTTRTLMNIIITIILMPLLKNVNNNNDDRNIVKELVSVSINTSLLSLLSYISSKNLNISAEGTITLYLNVIKLQDFVTIAKKLLNITGPLIVDIEPWHKTDAILQLLQTNSIYKVVGSIDISDENYHILTSNEIKQWTSLMSTSILCCKSSRSSKIHAIMTIDRSRL